MKYNKSLLLFCSLVFILLVGCRNSTEKNKEKSHNSAQNASTIKQNYSGNYVTEHYENRNDGYDWVAVSITEIIDNQLLVSVRSRNDKKTPTCTFDATFYKINDSLFHTFTVGKEVSLEIISDKLKFKTAQSGDVEAFKFHCSGGGSLAAIYHKIDSVLDPNQVETAVFSKVLRFHGMGFHISSVKKEYTSIATVRPFGLERINTPVSKEINGKIVDAVIADLNNDGSPEILIFTQSDGSGSYGDVIGFSVNNKKSMSQIYFTPTAENNSIKNGYMGHDFFYIEESKLVQRFPIYEEKDVNANPSGGKRYITYDLKDGEASRYFEIQTITEEQ